MIRAALLCLALAGCASQQMSLRYQGHNHLVLGENHAAVAVLQQAAHNGDVLAWNDLGVAYTRIGEHDKAIQALVMGARYGDTTAQQSLLARGLQPPSPDLAMLKAQRDAANAANAAATMTLINALNPPPRQPSLLNRQTSCTSYRVGNTIQTDCR